ncbi:MBL fold metallo-hydrolase, partial [bacterium]|nr:MBL fold metallo-hydrolase [bacterium]
MKLRLSAILILALQGTLGSCATQTDGDQSTDTAMLPDLQTSLSNRRVAKVTVLGTAQDAGLPQIGCQKNHCLAAWQDPSKRRLVSCLAITDVSDQKVFLIDATPDVREQVHRIETDPDLAKRQKRNPVDGVLLTHAHMGHYSGLLQFGFEAISTRELPVYATASMGTFLRENGPWSQLIDFKNIKLEQLQPERSVDITTNLNVEAFKVPHRDEFTDTVGYLVTGPNKRLLFIPDIDHWRVWERPLVKVLERVDYAFLDGSFFSPEELPNRDLSKIKHPLITQTIELLEELSSEFDDRHPRAALERRRSMIARIESLLSTEFVEAFDLERE